MTLVASAELAPAALMKGSTLDPMDSLLVCLNPLLGVGNILTVRKVAEVLLMCPLVLLEVGSVAGPG